MKTEAATAPGAVRLRRFYDRAARDYDRQMESFDRLLLGDGRRRLCSRASGRTLEIAVGTGRNLPFYSDNVRLTGIDLSPAMLAVARRRAEEVGIEAEIQLGDAQALEFADNSFDTVVCTLALCTIPDERRALAESHRVLRPGGQLLLLEHVRSPVAPVRWLERLFEPLMIRLASDHLARDPLDHLEAVGFHVERYERTKWGVVEEVVARKGSPAADDPKA